MNAAAAVKILQLLLIIVYAAILGTQHTVRSGENAAVGYFKLQHQPFGKLRCHIFSEMEAEIPLSIKQVCSVIGFLLTYCVGMLRDNNVSTVVRHAVEAATHHFAVIVGPLYTAVVENYQHIALRFESFKLFAHTVLIIKIHTRVVVSRGIFKLLGNVIQGYPSALMSKGAVGDNMLIVVTPAEILNACFS